MPSSSVLAAKIKKKDGKAIDGTVRGLVIQKGKHATENTVTYSVIKGDYIELIDERGVNLKPGSSFLYVVTRQKEIADYSETEAEIVGVLIGFFDGMREDSGFVARVGVGGGVVGSYVEAKELNAKDVLLGIHGVEQKKHKIISSLEIQATTGSISVPVIDIVAFK
jgi:hypothetical protein